MYIPDNMKMESVRHAYAFMHRYSFGLLVSSGLTGSHLPFLLQETEGQMGVLYAHFARANSHWQNLRGERVLVVFSGPHSYISPAWYTTRPAVPTWNYAAVHVYGRVELVDESATSNSIDRLIEKHDPSLFERPDILDVAFRQRLLSSIVGFRVVIDDIQGKIKLGQQRSAADRQGVVEGLSAVDTDESRALLECMRFVGINVP